MTDKRIVAIPDDVVMNKIILVRNQKVMLDTDLAVLYGIETKVLKQAVRRNLNRFPEDFMFEMNKEEFESLRSQHVTSNPGRGGARYMPFCFTEQGVTMLSCILNSERAVHVNVQIIRIYTRLREVMLLHKDFSLLIEQIENKLHQQDEKIATLFAYLSKFMDVQESPRIIVGFKLKSQEVNVTQP